MILLSNIEGGYSRSEFMCWGKDQRQVNVLSLVCAKIFSDSEAFSVANHFVDGSEAKLCHNSSQFIGDVVKEVDDMLGCALELCSKLRVLRGDADWASIPRCSG
jgi:hypothetical protein